MIILSTAALGDGRATLSRGYSYSKNERLKLRNEVWERNGGRESKTLTREKSHSNEIGSIWNVCLFCAQMQINWPHLITDHQSETEQAWEGRDSKATWKEIETTSFISVLQFSIIKIIFTWKFDLLFWPIVRFYLRHFVLIRKRIYCTFDANSSLCDFIQEMMLRSATLHMLFRYSLVQYILVN